MMKILLLCLWIFLLSACSNSQDFWVGHNELWDPVTGQPYAKIVDDKRLVSFIKTFKPKNGGGPHVKLVGKSLAGTKQYDNFLLGEYELNNSNAIQLEGIARGDGMLVFLPYVGLCNTLGDMEIDKQLASKVEYLQLSLISSYSQFISTGPRDGGESLELLLSTEVAKKYLADLPRVNPIYWSNCSRVLYVIEQAKKEPDFIDICGFKNIDVFKSSEKATRDMINACREKEYASLDRKGLASYIVDRSQYWGSSHFVHNVFREAFLDLSNDRMINAVRNYLGDPSYQNKKLIIVMEDRNMVLPNGKGIEDRLINEFGYEIVSQEPFVVFEF